MNKHKGSNFDDFLDEEGILEEVSANGRYNEKIQNIES